MPRFSESENKQIYEDIIIKGKELFSLYGLKKTSIDEIVNTCGIGKGTFYKFFNSKEELYFEILEREESFRDQYLKEMLESELKPKEAFKQFLFKSIDYVQNSPILQRLLDRQELELLFRKLPKEKLNKHFQNDVKASLSFISYWQEQGYMRNEKPEVIVGILRTLYLMLNQKDEIGEEIFPLVLNKYIEMIVDGLFT